MLVFTKWLSLCTQLFCMAFVAISGQAPTAIRWVFGAYTFLVLALALGEHIED